MSGAQCSRLASHSARRKIPVLYLQTSVDNIKPEGHDPSLQGSQIRLYLVSHFLNHVRSRSHMLAPSFFVSLGTCMTVGLRILLAESFKATAGDRCIILIEVHESCVLNSPCYLESFLQWLMYQYHWSTVIQITCTINLIKLMSCWYYPGSLFDFYFGLPCVAWLCAVLCPSCPLPHLSCPPCLPACQLPLCRSALCSAKPQWKTAMPGEIYGVRVSREWKSFLEVIACPWDQGGISDLLTLQSLSLCNVPKRSRSHRGRNRLKDRLLPCLQETAQIALLLPETQWFLMPFLV